jgi:uncharacterized protein with HEPN domain
MHDCIIKILSYTEGYDYNRFSEDDKTIDAVVRNVEIIGEATKHLSDEIKKMDSQIPWKAIAGMRDKLVHDYFGVDKRFVWNTVKDDIPFLQGKINFLLDQIEE